MALSLLCLTGNAKDWKPIYDCGEMMGRMVMWRPSRTLMEMSIGVPLYRMHLDFKDDTQGFTLNYNAKGFTRGEVDLVNGTVEFTVDGKTKGKISCAENPDACRSELDIIQFYITDFRRHLDLFPEGPRLDRVTGALNNADKKLEAMRKQLKEDYGIGRRVNHHYELFH